MKQGDPWRTSSLLLLVLHLPACVHPERAEMRPFDSPPPFTDGGEADMVSEWWTAFGDTALNAHIERALDENFSLDAAWQRLRAANAIVEREEAFLFPTLDAIVAAVYERGDDDGLRRDGDDSNGFDDDSDLDDEGETFFDLGLEAAYEVDLWGRIESRVEAERFRASATLAEYRTAALTLAAEVARTWYQLVEARLQLAVVEQQVETNRTVLELLGNRFAAGQIRSADVLRQRQLVEATREQAIVVRSRIDVLKNLLAVLCGMPPQAEMDTEARQPSLPALPSLPATGLPGELVERRPDVRRAFLLLKAADRDLASAVGAQYPRIQLSASISTAAEHPENLFREWLASLAGQVIAPLFDGGERRAEVDRTAAVRDQRIAEYGQAVLVAFQEVEDALSQERHQLERMQSMEAQAELARQTSQQLRTQYLSGVTDYIAVLTALIEEQRLERDLLTARLLLLEFRIALYRALAGGFETERERETAEAPDGRADDG